VIAVLGVDPGFASFGYALARYNPTSDTHEVRAMGVIRTKKATKKQNLLASEDSFQRTRDIAAALTGIVRANNVKALAFEAFSPPQRASKMNLVKIGFPYGVLAALAVEHELPTIQMSPQRIRKVLGTDSKDAAEALLRGAFPEAWRLLEDAGVAEGMRNHAWDALAAYMASWDTDTMRMLRNAHR
jgi:Holliday junction resolvasome RuvABC endonuclease subunit